MRGQASHNLTPKRNDYLARLVDHARAQALSDQNSHPRRPKQGILCQVIGRETNDLVDVSQIKELEDSLSDTELQQIIDAYQDIMGDGRKTVFTFK